MKFSQSRMHKLLAFIFVLLAGVSSMAAQTTYGAIRGEVKDTQGANIAKAQVTLTNQDTKVVNTDVTNSAGVYLFGAIDPGTYKVTIVEQGFKTFETTGNVVTLGATTTVDAVMVVGAKSETVEVTAESVTLNTANATAEQVFTGQQVQDLPNLGRDPFMFAQFDANVVTLGDPRFVRAEDSSGISDVSLGGAPGSTNSYVVDGIPVSTSSGGATFVVSPDAVSEAKIQADTFDAEIGRTGGGVFNNTLKVGSSQYHGELYGETRQTPWSANVYTFPGSIAGKIPTDTTYLYSGAVGGPLVPPAFKDKVKWLDNTFVWLTEEGYRQGQPISGSTSAYYVPTLAERTGDFSADGALYDPTVAATTSARPVTFASECGGYNVIPGSPAAAKYGTACGGNNYFNGLGFSMANAFPVPLGANASGVYGSGANFAVSGVGFKTRADESVSKIEHQFFPWWTSQFSYLHSGVQEPQATFANAFAAAASGDELEDRKFDSTALNNTFTINSSTLLTVGYGFNRYWSAFPYYATQGISFTNGFPFNGASYGFSQAFAGEVPLTSYPTITLSGPSSGGFSAPGLGGAFSGYTPQASHNFVMVASRTIKTHNVRVGYTYRGFSYWTDPPSTPGSFTFNGQYSDATGLGSGSSNGYAAIADLEMGLPSSLSETLYAGPFLNRESYNSVWMQDDFRLNQKITFNAGIRYEYELGQHEVNNKFNVAFSPTAPVTYTNNAGTAVSTAGGLLFAGAGGAPIHCCGNSHTKFSPRIGVAYQVAKNIVMHAGYGFFYAPVGITTSYNQGFSQSTSPTITAPGATTGTIAAVATTAIGNTGSCLSNPFFQSVAGATCGGGLLQPSGSTLGTLTGTGGGLSVFDQKRQYPLVQQYMMDLQYKLPFDFIVTISYVGTHATNFPLSVNINQIPDAVMGTYAAGGANVGTSLAGTVPNPYYATSVKSSTGAVYPTTGVLNQAKYALGQTLMPFPFDSSISEVKSVGYGWYNSFVLKAEKRVTNGLTVLATYTHAADWDNLFSGIGSQTTSTSGPQDNYNLAPEFARSLDSVPNRVTMAITDVLPVGRGKRFLGSPSGFAGKALDYVVGGWEINYEQLISNGVPLTVTQSDVSTHYGPTGTGGSVQRPTVISGDPHSACMSGKPQTRLGAGGLPGYLNAAAFAPTQAYEYGNAPRTLPCRAPGYDSATASLAKNLFTIHDRFKLQYRIEALNLWNTPQFATPGTTLSVSNYGTTAGGALFTPATATAPYGGLGVLSAQAGFGRIVQMGGKLTF
jgi:trimeric autotransporter adhesin